MQTYYRPIPMLDAARPVGALALAGGWVWFDRVERLTRDGSQGLVPARDLPGDVLEALTAPRAALLRAAAEGGGDAAPLPPPCAAGLLTLLGGVQRRMALIADPATQLAILQKASPTPLPPPPLRPPHPSPPPPLYHHLRPPPQAPHANPLVMRCKHVT